MSALMQVSGAMMGIYTHCGLVIAYGEIYMDHWVKMSEWTIYLCKYLCYLSVSYQLYVIHARLGTKIKVLLIHSSQYATNPTRNTHTNTHTYIWCYLYASMGISIYMIHMQMCIYTQLHIHIYCAKTGFNYRDSTFWWVVFCIYVTYAICNF